MLNHAQCRHEIISSFGSALKRWQLDPLDRAFFRASTVSLLEDVGIPEGWFGNFGLGIECIGGSIRSHYGDAWGITLGKIGIKGFTNNAVVYVRSGADTDEVVVFDYSSAPYVIHEDAWVFLACLGIWEDEHRRAERDASGFFVDHIGVASRLRSRMLACSSRALDHCWSNEICEIEMNDY